MALLGVLAPELGGVMPKWLGGCSSDTPGCGTMAIWR
jgi:hypothetical protein